ncbi:MAG: hypothetical protein F4Y61_07295, partial [Rhodothermaceae bacterium]|nr:hypothetical protein [Rhodothermaceae bacterium]
MREPSSILVPTSYQLGYEKARSVDRVLADLYVRHTTIGDPELDPVIKECSESLPPDVFSRYVRAGILQKEDFLTGAPDSLREFFRSVDNTNPPWLYYESFRPAT